MFGQLWRYYRRRKGRSVTAMMCLAIAVFFEARNQEIDGMYAVAQVIENRVESEKFPDDVCEVVFQEKQFSFTHDGKSDNPVKYDSHYDRIMWDVSKEVAKDVLREDPFLFETSTHYHATYVKPKWASKLTLDGKVNDHIFYTEE